MTFFAPLLGTGSIGPIEALVLVAIVVAFPVAFLRGVFKEKER